MIIFSEREEAGEEVLAVAALGSNRAMIEFWPQGCTNSVKVTLTLLFVLATCGPCENKQMRRERHHATWRWDWKRTASSVDRRKS